MTDRTSIPGEKENVAAITTLVFDLIGFLVDKPNEVSVRAITNGQITSLQVRVAPEDMGKLIGKQGRTARSLRTILSAASTKLQQRFALDIVEGRS